MSAKIDIVQQWIEKADHDLGTAQVTIQDYKNFQDFRIGSNESDY